MILSTKLYGQSYKVAPGELERPSLRLDGQERLEHSFIVEAKVSVATDDDVVENAYAHNITDFF